MRNLLVLLGLTLMSANAMAYHLEFNCTNLAGEKLIYINDGVHLARGYINGVEVPTRRIEGFPRSYEPYGNNRYSINYEEYVFGPVFNSSGKKTTWKMYQSSQYGYALEELKCAVTEK